MHDDERDWVAREQEARRLGSGPDDATTTHRLVRAAHDPEPEVRKVALESLGKLTPTRRRVAALLGGLDDPEWEVRWAAARGLTATAPRSAAVRAALQRATGDPDAAVAGAAHDALTTA